MRASAPAPKLHLAVIGQDGGERFAVRRHEILQARRAGLVIPGMDDDARHSGNVLRRVDHDAACRQVHGRHVGAGEGHQCRCLEPRSRDFDQVARAVVVDRTDAPDLGPAGIEHGQADQVGMVEFVIRQRRQRVTVGIEPHAFQGIGLFLGGDPVDIRREAGLDRPGQGQGKTARPSSVQSVP